MLNFRREVFSCTSGTQYSSAMLRNVHYCVLLWKHWIGGVWSPAPRMHMCVLEQNTGQQTPSCVCVCVCVCVVCIQPVSWKFWCFNALLRFTRGDSKDKYIEHSTSFVIYSLSCRWEVRWSFYRNISGASQQNSVAEFPWTTEVD